MDSELTWEQEQDIQEYTQAQIEEDWNASMDKAIAKAAKVWEIEHLAKLDALYQDDWREYDHVDHEAGAAYWDEVAQGK